MTHPRPTNPRLTDLQRLRRRVDQAILDEVARIRADALTGRPWVRARRTPGGNCYCGATGLPEPHHCGALGCDHQ